MCVVLGAAQCVPEGKVDGVVGAEDLVVAIVVKGTRETKEGRETFEPGDRVAAVLDDADDKEAERGEEKGGDMDREKEGREGWKELNDGLDGMEGHCCKRRGRKELVVDLVGKRIDEGLVKESMCPILPSVVADPRRDKLERPERPSVLLDVPVEHRAPVLRGPDADRDEKGPKDDAHKRPEALRQKDSEGARLSRLDLVVACDPLADRVDDDARAKVKEEHAEEHHDVQLDDALARPVRKHPRALFLDLIWERVRPQTTETRHMK